MNGYVSIDNNFADAIIKFAVSADSEITVTGIHKYLDSLFSINKLLVASGSFIDRINKRNEYNCVFNIFKNSDNDIIITILFGNIVIGASVAPNDKISKIGG